MGNGLKPRAQRVQDALAALGFTNHLEKSEPPAEIPRMAGGLVTPVK